MAEKSQQHAERLALPRGSVLYWGIRKNGNIKLFSARLVKVIEGGEGMNEDAFKMLLQKIVDRYQLSPETAAQMLQRILTVLADTQKERSTL